MRFYPVWETNRRESDFDMIAGHTGGAPAMSRETVGDPGSARFLAMWTRSFGQDWYVESLCFPTISIHKTLETAATDRSGLVCVSMEIGIAATNQWFLCLQNPAWCVFSWISRTQAWTVARRPERRLRARVLSPREDCHQLDDVAELGSYKEKRVGSADAPRLCSRSHR